MKVLYSAQSGLEPARIESITAHKLGLRCLIAEDEEILVPSVALQTRITANTREERFCVCNLPTRHHEDTFNGYIQDISQCLLVTMLDTSTGQLYCNGLKDKVYQSCQKLTTSE